MTVRINTQNIRAQESLHTSGVYIKRDLTLVRGKGARVWDVDDNEYIDCVAGIAVTNTGHCHPRVVQAIQQQAAEMLSCSEIFYNDQRALFSTLLTEKAPGMDRVFLCNSGAEANEAALKFAKVITKRPGVVATMRGFHGRTLGALSATWEKKYRKPFEPLLPGFAHVPYDDLAKLDAAVGDETGAVILEVLQGEGGVRPASAEYLRGAQELCKDRGALLILDEVQTGFGRTGRMFGYEHYGLEPDLVALAKGIASGVPMGACLIAEWLPELPPRIHGSTFGGNPLACAAALATLEALEADKLVARAEAMGARLMDGLRAIESPHIRDVRGLGLLVGVELKKKVAPLIQALTAEGVLALPAGATVLRFVPPLVITEEEIDQVISATERALSVLDEQS